MMLNPVEHLYRSPAHLAEHWALYFIVIWSSWQKDKVPSRRFMQVVREDIGGCTGDLFEPLCIVYNFLRINNKINLYVNK